MKLQVWMLFFMVLLGSCKTADPTVSESDLEFLDKNSFTGSRVKTFPVPGGPDEICVIPKKFPGADYDSDDLDDEKELCSLDFRDPMVGVCPKLSSTNPGLEIYKLNPGDSKETFETEECRNPSRNRKKVAKYKMSITCSYTGSIISYYHMARLLGISSVPPSAVRTFDLDSHKKYSKRGVSYSQGRGYISTTWNQLDSALYKNDKWLLTTDLRQTFGALSVNPTGEMRHPLINVKPYSSFIAKPWVKKVMNGASVRESLTDAFFSSVGIKPSSHDHWEFQRATYGIKVMEDISNMILIDYLMGQQDRLGNIHSSDYHYYKNTSGKIKKSKASKSPNPSTLGSTYTNTAVPRLVLKDNDCGIRSADASVFEKNNSLENVRHMSRGTYKRLMWLANNWSAVRSLLTKESTMATKNFWQEDLNNPVSGNVISAKKILYNNCKAGKLLLDLDVEDHLEGTNTKASVASYCDEVYSPTSSTGTEGNQSPPVAGGSTTPVVTPAVSTSCQVRGAIVNVRDQPNSANGIVRNKLSDGHPVKALREQGGWTSVSFKDGGSDFGESFGSERWIFSGLLDCN